MSEDNRPEFDDSCEFFEQIQKNDPDPEPKLQEFVDLETEGAAPKKTRLERLQEKQLRRETREEEHRQRREQRHEDALHKYEARMEAAQKKMDAAEERREQKAQSLQEKAAEAQKRREQRQEDAQQIHADVQQEVSKKRNRVDAKLDRHRFNSFRKLVFQCVEVGYDETGLSRGYDVLNLLTILINVTVSILYTFDYFELHAGGVLHMLEAVTVAFFALDYVLRIWTAPLLYPQERSGTAVRKYMTSFWGIVDLISFLPFYLPFFPEGGAVFRLFRVVRIFRLFRINNYSDSLGAIMAVLKSKRQQLVSSVFIILVLMLSASLCMYSVEHDAQPEVFRNALSGIWWASSALLTVGYGDMYPITVAGKILGMMITFLGVGMVAIPTGIISAGFVEQFQRIREQDEQEGEVDFHFIKVQLNYKDQWVGMKIMDLQLPHNVVVAVIQRGNSTIVPRGDVVLQEKDTLVLGAESAHDKEWDLDLKEIILKRKHPWNGQFIRDLDISRQTFIVLVRRRNRSMVPNGNLMLREGDTVVLYSKKHIQDEVKIEL